MVTERIYKRTGKISGRAALESMHKKAIGAFYENQGLTFWEKADRIRTDYAHEHPYYGESALIAAAMLDFLRERGEIKDWFNTDRFSVLDARFKVDKVIVTNDFRLIPIQESSRSMVRQKRKQIKEIYRQPAEKVVPILRLNTKRGKPLSDEAIFNQILRIVRETPGINLNNSNGHGGKNGYRHGSNDRMVK